MTLLSGLIVIFVFGGLYLCISFVIFPLADVIALKVLEVVCAPVLIGLQHSFKKQPLRIPKDHRKRTEMMLGAALMLLYICIGVPITIFLFFIKPAMQKQLDPTMVLDGDKIINSLWPALFPAIMFAVGLFIVYRISKKTAEQDHDQEYFKRANFYQNAWKFLTWLVALLTAFYAGKNL